MPEIPVCLHRRYRALDALISELNALSTHGSHEEVSGDRNSHDPGIKLMCDFWNILKEDPDCDLGQAVKQRMGLEMHGTSNMIPRQKVTCYMAGRSGGGRNVDKNKDALNKIKDICCGSETSNKQPSPTTYCPTSSSRDRPDDIPLTKALCNLKEAASLDKKCNVRVSELMETQKELKAQIQNLETREKAGVALLKEADCMWSCMEEGYKKKISESLERQKELMKQLKEVETSNTKWRKNKKELDDQLKNVAKCRQEINDKLLHKSNDLKIIDMEIADFNKRIIANKRLSEGSSQALDKKKTNSNKKLASIEVEVTKLKSTLTEITKHKREKDDEGKKYVKEARDDLQNICKVLLQKKIENEDLLAEKEALLQELELLKQSSDLCKDKCQAKRDSIERDIKKTEKEIADYRYQCVQCHQCTDTTDARNFCSDCPKCKEQRECITQGDHCDRDYTYDCVCMSVKEKFLSNVFENMYTVMERQSNTKPGKALADSIVKCLKNSRNGKLSAETKQQVQEFVLNTVKKNLNLTIVGGAVKTRCELDQETYNQLMLCTKQVKPEKPPKEDKGTVPKKDSCARWGGPTECNCPGGAKYCACTQRAPPPPKDPVPCPPVLEKEEDKTTVVLCPHKEVASCGTDCSMATPGPPVPPTTTNAGCDASCPFKKNVRAAQCVLGPESLNSLPKTFMSSTPYVPSVSGTTNKITNRHGTASPNAPECRRGEKQLKTVCKNRSTYTTREQNSLNYTSGGLFIDKSNQPLSKHKLTSMTSSISSQATALAESFCNTDNLLQKNRSLKKTNQAQIKMNKSWLSDENVQPNNKTKHVDSSGSYPVEIKDAFIDITKPREDPEPLMKIKRSHSGHSIMRRIENQLIDIKEDKKVNIAKEMNIRSDSEVVTLKNEKSRDHENDCLLGTTQDINVLKTELCEKYEKNESIAVKLINNGGRYKAIKAPVSKTLSGNLAVSINELYDNMTMINKDCNVTLIKSYSGTLILNKTCDGCANGEIRQSAHGSLLLVITDPVTQPQEIVKENVSAQLFYKVKIVTEDSFSSEPPAVLKETPSHNYLIIPDKEYENQFKESIGKLLEDCTEYYVKLTKVDSQNFILYINDSWKNNELNALVIKNYSGEVKICPRKKAELPLDSGRKRTLITSSSKGLPEIMDRLPRTGNDRKLSTSMKSISKKSSSDSNVYDKVKLLHSTHNDLLGEPSAILKMTNLGEYAVVLEKDSKLNFIKNLRSYLKNNPQGLVPIKKMESGNIKIDLKGEQTDKNHLYGSLKITPSGNLYVTLDKELAKGTLDEESLHSNAADNSFTDVTSRHIIGKLQHPVNKSVTTTCNGMPGSECDKSKCACADMKLSKINWILNRDQTDKTVNIMSSQFSEIDWSLEVLSDINDTFNDAKSSENGSFTSKNDNTISCDDTTLPHISIKPCSSQTLNNVHADKKQCYYVIDVSPHAEKVSEFQVCNDNRSEVSWDSLSYLPPQLPDFLKDIKYK